jgi:hypothetical protein
MKVVHIRDNEVTIATLKQAEGMADKDFEEIAIALMLTLANQLGRPLEKVDVGERL